MYKVEMLGVRTLVAEGKIVWTEHVAIRLRERGIKRSDLIECITNGEIIEQYPDDVPYPSCLVSGKCKTGKPLHIVIGYNKDILCCMITAYRPDMDKWENDYKTRRKGI